MAETTQYDVVANLVTKGGGGMSKLVDDSKRLSAGWDQMGAGLGKIMDGAGALAGTLGTVITTATAIGGAAAGAMLGAAGIGVAYVGGAMAELEGKSIQLASVLAAATKTPFDVMQQQSKALFDQFRQDAVTSAGETSDFVNVAAKIGGPIMGAGKSMEDLHRITKGVVEMAPSLGIAFEQAGSDVMRMLQGTAGMESPLFAAMIAIPSLGIKKAEEFNKLSPEKRIAKLEEALKNPAFANAANAYGNSWKGLVSTFEDVAKGAGMALGEPLFGLAKRGLASFNKEAMRFSQNEGGLWLSRLGKVVAGDFETLGRALGRLFPDFSHSGRVAIDIVETLVRSPIHALTTGSEWIASHWKEIKSGAREAAGYLADAADRAVSMVRALGGGDLQEGLKRAGELAVAMKVAQIAAPVATMGAGVVGIGGGAARVLGGLFAGGGGAAAAATGAEAAAAGGGATAAVAGGGLAAALGPLAIVLAGVGAGVVAFKQDLFGLGRETAATWDRIVLSSGRLWKALEGLGTSLMKLGALAVPVIALLGTQFVVAISVLSAALEIALDGLTALANGLSWLVDESVKSIKNAKKLLGFEDPTLNPFVDTADDDKRETPGVGTWIMPAGPTQLANDAANRDAYKKSRDATKPTTQKVVVELKLELGDGNEDAVYIRTGKMIDDMFRNARMVQRTSRLPGA